ncbi:MAG: FKBP-type peptidyl-prolyl cis-trans isomerase [Propionibacteriaceae bacterium]|jgi:peptidylprolyl isomerase|nr:FKBP-type peptidyl-prolyl cis-trans isomerase [Propionibacteriaceae bacterium]
MTRKAVSQVVGCVLALGVTLALASCSDPGTTGTPTPTVTPTEATAAATPTTPVATELPVAPTPTVSITASASLDAITVSGAYGEAPTVTVPSPWAIDATRTKVLVQGDGATVPDTGIVEMNYYGVNARTGTLFDESFSSGSSVAMSLAGTIPGFQKGLAGQQVGSRVLIAIPGADGYDANGGQSSAGIEVGDTLVFVVDIVKTSVTEPTGAAQEVSDASLPTVTGDLNAPVVTIPSKQDPPAASVTQLLVKGDGPVVQATDAVYVNYAEYVWKSGKLIRKTYGYTPMQGLLSATLPGWQSALVGQTIGSRVMLVLTPADSYPDGNPKMGIDAGSTMVYVVDVLFAGPQWWSTSS